MCLCVCVQTQMSNHVFTDRIIPFWLNGCNYNALFVLICSTSIWLTLCLRDDSQSVCTKWNKGSQCFFNLFLINQGMQIVVCLMFLIYRKPTGNTQDEFQTDHVHKIRTLTPMQASLYRTTRKLSGTQFVQWGEWYSACCFVVKGAPGLLDWFKRYVTVPCG